MTSKKQAHTIKTTGLIPGGQINYYAPEYKMTFAAYCAEAKNLIAFAETMMETADTQKLGAQQHSEIACVGIVLRESLREMAGRLVRHAGEILACMPIAHPVPSECLPTDPRPEN